MYDFTEFEGEDRWIRFEALKIKMHENALHEYFQENYNEAVSKGKTRFLIEFSKGVMLKDGSRLTSKELEEYAEANNLTLYPADESPNKKILREFLNN